MRLPTLTYLLISIWHGQKVSLISGGPHWHLHQSLCTNELAVNNDDEQSSQVDATPDVWCKRYLWKGLGYRFRHQFRNHGLCYNDYTISTNIIETITFDHWRWLGIVASGGSDLCNEVEKILGKNPLSDESDWTGYSSHLDGQCWSAFFLISPLDDK